MAVLRHIHPFPARMAPEIALSECQKLGKEMIVLDPMCGSGTTLRAAIESGLHAIGGDLDPLAVLISKVNTTPLDAKEAVREAKSAALKAELLGDKTIKLDWIDNDLETRDFISFWFAPMQISALRKLVFIIQNDYEGDIQNFLKIALSRIIITKEKGASLARDTSHSRPHKVSKTNDYDVLSNFIKSAEQASQRLPAPHLRRAQVHNGDARNLSSLRDESVDAVITSPPYLNAIDYMRGHKLALVWLGFRLQDLRIIRGTSIGTERGPDTYDEGRMLSLTKNMEFYSKLGGREKRMFDRYTLDLYVMMGEISRVLKRGGKAVLVVGNSCLKGVFIKNTQAVKSTAEVHGLNLIEELERNLPMNLRYLPTSDGSALAKRMRTETIMYFAKS